MSPSSEKQCIFSAIRLDSNVTFVTDLPPTTTLALPVENRERRPSMWCKHQRYRGARWRRDFGGSKTGRPDRGDHLQLPITESTRKRRKHDIQEVGKRCYRRHFWECWRFAARPSAKSSVLDQLSARPTRGGRVEDRQLPRVPQTTTGTPPSTRNSYGIAFGEREPQLHGSIPPTRTVTASPTRPKSPSSSSPGNAADHPVAAICRR